MRAVNPNKFGFGGTIKNNNTVFEINNGSKTLLTQELQNFLKELEAKTPAESIFSVDSIKARTIKEIRKFGSLENGCVAAKKRDYCEISITNEVNGKNYKFPILVGSKSEYGNDVGKGKSFASVSFEQITPIKQTDIRAQLKEFLNTLIKEDEVLVMACKSPKTGMQILYKKAVMALRSLF